ncbi:Nuf2 family-domain-containing protein [Tribonema minus]|uniref:Nuf2 family-domain-containing protein n=1 Tax=Tribonema minus TaxID=303371 RepID=A0A835ZCC3_9STRA|nr:Nuf2 family-domain-containing protein [Tribonema minus]
MSSRMSFAPEPVAAAGVYSFPTLKAKLILERLQQLQIPTSEETLDNPQKNVQEVQNVFAKLVEFTMGVTREEMNQPVFAGLNVLNYAQLHEDSVPELAFFRAVSKMMTASCVHDFSFNDLQTPNKTRLKRQLSAVINFCMFREGRMQVYNALATEKENLLANVQALGEDNERLERELASLTERTSQEAAETEMVEADCRAMEAQISALNREQAATRAQSGDLKRQANGLKDRLAALDLETKEAIMERERLQAQIVSSPDRIRREMADQQAALEQERTEGMAAEKQAQRTELTAANVARAEREVVKATRALDDIEEELGRQKEALREVRAAQRALAENGAKSAAAAADAAVLRRHAARLDEKLAHLRRQGRARAEAADASLAALRAELAEEEAARQAELAEAEAAEAEVRQLEELLATERAQAAAEAEDHVRKFKSLEGAVLQYHKLLRAAMQGPLPPPSSSSS